MTPHNKRKPMSGETLPRCPSMSILSPTSPMFHKRAIATRNATSAELFMMKAFVAAAPAAGRSDQNPISRYEEKPTSSQKKNRQMSSPEKTTPSIQNVKKPRHT